MNKWGSFDVGILMFVFVIVMCISVVFWLLVGSNFVVIESFFCLVNLMVLFKRFVRICWIWLGFEFIFDLLIFDKFIIIFSFFFCVKCVIDWVVFLINFFILNLMDLISSLFVFILEKFKILLIRVSRELVFEFVMLMCCDCLVVRLFFLSRFSIFIMLFIGVLILWFIFVRNLDFNFVVFLVCFSVFFKLLVWVFNEVVFFEICCFNVWIKCFCLVIFVCCKWVFK